MLPAVIPSLSLPITRASRNHISCSRWWPIKFGDQVENASSLDDDLWTYQEVRFGLKSFRQYSALPWLVLIMLVRKEADEARNRRIQFSPLGTSRRRKKITIIIYFPLPSTITLLVNKKELLSSIIVLLQGRFMIVVGFYFKYDNLPSENCVVEEHLSS